MDARSPYHADDTRRYRARQARPLSADARGLLHWHFRALSAADRRLRFGASLSEAAVAAYVERIDFEEDAVFGIIDEEGVLIGVAHVALRDGVAELGLSVLPDKRGWGAGQALFARASVHASCRGATTLFMHCLAENAVMMHIARKAGMDIVIAAGDADACLALPPPHTRNASRLRSVSTLTRTGASQCADLRQ